MEECRERTMQLYLHQIHTASQKLSAPVVSDAVAATTASVASDATTAAATVAPVASDAAAVTAIVTPVTSDAVAATTATDSPAIAVTVTAADQSFNQTDLILLAALKDYRQRTGIGLAESDAVSVMRTKMGRPYFISEDKTPCSTQCSVSHSGRYWICALSEFRLGIDLEDPDNSRRHNGERIARRFFSPEEEEYVRQEGEAAFYRLWVRKEALLKYRGTGLAGLGACSVLEPALLWISNFTPKLGVFAAVCAAVPLKWKEIVEL